MSTPAALLAVLASEPAVPGLAQAVSTLSERYRDGVTDNKRGMTTDIERAAYVAARMPATAAAVAACLEMAQPHDILTVLDLGSGPGSALWSLQSHFPHLKKITAFERDAALITIGKRLAHSGDMPLKEIEWISGDVNFLPALTRHDLVMASYVTNELQDNQRLAFITAAWELTNCGFLIIEPGTPRGFAAIEQIRAHLISLGATIAAPCGHQQSCPITRELERTTWCHFRVRVPRSRMHRQIKSASLGFEDEPFSFLYATRDTHSGPEKARIISTPRIHKGSAHLAVCTADGLRDLNIPRRNKDLYKLASRSSWGDNFPILE